MQTTANVLQFFAVRTSKRNAVPGASGAAAAAGSSGGQAELKRVDVFLERSTVVEGAALAADIVGDSRAIVVRLPTRRTPHPDGTLCRCREVRAQRRQHARRCTSCNWQFSPDARPE